MMSKENTSDNLSEIHWLRLDNDCLSGYKNWFKLSESDGVESIQKCQKVEDIENVLHEKCNKPTYRYTKAELLRLKGHPLSQKQPIIGDNLKSLFGKTVPSKDESELKKDQLRKKPIRLFEAGKKYDAKEIDLSRNREKPNVIFRNDKTDERKPTDPATRIRKEQDICLSPQRKSFNTGCFVQNVKTETNGAGGNSNKSNSEGGSSGNRENYDNRENRDGRENREYRDGREHRDHRDHRDHREMKENRNAREAPRRIGSGRIITSDPPFVMRGYADSRQMPKDKPTVVYKCTFQGKTNDREKDGVWDRQKNVFDRRRNQYSDQSYEEDNNRNRFWDQPRTNVFERRRPYHNDHHRDDDEEKEPEWMRDGPGSKNDMIELKGFDENVERFFRGGRKGRFSNETNRNASNSSELLKRASESDTSSVVSDSVSEKPAVSCTKNTVTNSETAAAEKATQKVEEKPASKPLEGHSIELNLDEIFKEPLLDLNAGMDTGESAGSKFTRWFKKDDSNSVHNPVVSTSLNESLQSMMNAAGKMADQDSKLKTSTTTMTPGDVQSQNVAQSSNLLELIRGSQEKTLQSKMDVRVLEATGKLHSLEEIEAKLRGTDRNMQTSTNASGDRIKKEEEAKAFKKLLFQALKTDDGAVNPTTNDELRFPTQKDKNEIASPFQSKTDLSSLFCNGDVHPTNFPPNMLPPQVSRMLPMNNGKQFPMQQNKQEMLSKMFMSNNNSFASPPQQAGIRTPNTPMPPGGGYSPITPEIQSRINECQLTRELMQRQETVVMLRALKKGDLTVHHLIEQYKKTTPSQMKFRESVICVLKLMQQTPYVNVSPFAGSPMGMSFNVPPPSHSSAVPYNENLIQQMMMNSQYCNGLPNIVYQRDFSVQNQNIFANKKLSSEQTQNVNQMPARMNSPLTIGVSSLSTVPGTSSMSPSNSINLPRDQKNSAVLSMKAPPTSQSHSFTPISVLRQLSADKENLDTVSRDSKETKLGDLLAGSYTPANAANISHSNPLASYGSSVVNVAPWNNNAKPLPGEKNALVPYSAGSSSQQCNSVCISAGVIEHFNSFGSCIPPPAISGQYFVGNMIRPSSLSSSIPIFNNPPPPILSRLPMSADASIVAKGSQKLSINSSQLQQMQQMRAISSHVPQGPDSLNASSNRTNSDGIISSSSCGNQNLTLRNSFMNGLLPSGEDQLNRLFANNSINQSFPLSGNNVPVSLPNIISVEEIERMQQSVRN